MGALDYTPYGAVKATQPGGILPDFQYAGLMWVGEIGLNASATRFYDGSTTRWMTRDWIGEDGGVNLYGYLLADPINGIDPDGTKCKKKRMLVTAYCDKGPGRDWKFYKPDRPHGKPKQVGPKTCAVANSDQQPYNFGCKMTFRDGQGKTVYQCAVHDTGAGWDPDHHDVSPDEWADIWMRSCKQARKFGKRWLEAEICDGK